MQFHPKKDLKIETKKKNSKEIPDLFVRVV